MEGQPIETAPKGQMVLLYWPEGGVIRGRNGPKLTAMMRVDWPSSTPNRPPTHWMPLPEPPK